VKTVRKPEVWDEEAVRDLESDLRDLKSGKPKTEWLRYVGKSFSKATEIGLNYVQSENVNVLKTDLWNEVVEHRGDSISKYQNKENFRLHGIDISKVVCFQARSKVKNVRIIQAIIENLPFKGNFFDLILDLSTLDHISETKALGVLQEYRRVLNKNGILVLVFSIAARFRHIRAGPSSNVPLHYVFSHEFVGKVQNSFNVLEEYNSGTLFFDEALKKLPMQVRDFMLNALLTLEYSRFSKSILKNLGAFYVIIAEKT